MLSVGYERMELSSSCTFLFLSSTTFIRCTRGTSFRNGINPSDELFCDAGFDFCMIKATQGLNTRVDIDIADTISVELIIVR